MEENSTKEKLKSFILNQGLIISIMIIIIYIAIYWHTKQLSYFTKWTSEHNGESARIALPTIVQQLGYPSQIDPRAKGGAIWFENTLRDHGIICFNMVLILDEAIPTEEPVPHATFLYIWSPLRIPFEYATKAYWERLGQLLQLSKSITYDRVKEEICVRTNSLGAGKATIMLAQQVAEGNLNLLIAETYEVLKKLIEATDPKSPNYDPQAEHNYMNEICRFIDMQKIQN